MNPVEVCWWVTYLAGSSSPGEYGAHGKCTPLALNCIKIGVQAAFAPVKIQTFGLCPPVRSEIMMIAVRAYEEALRYRG